MTPQEFAQKIRTKYPGAYDRVPDDELTKKVIAKYPVYASQVKISPPKTNLYSDIVTGAEKGAVESMGALSSIGEFVANQTAGRLINATQGKGFTPTKVQPSILTQEGSPELKAQNTGEKIGKAAEFALEAVLPTGNKVTKPLDLAKKGVAKIADNRALQSGKKLFDEAIDIVAPKVTKTTEEEAFREGRIIREGLLNKTKITPSVQDQKVAESVQGLVKKNLLPEENIKNIGTEVSRIDQGVRNMIAQRKVPFNESQLRTKLTSVKEDSKIIFASDPTIEKTYDAVIEEFVKQVRSKDTLGLFEARQSFDKLSAVRKLLESEKFGENVRKQVVLDVRRAANEYVSELLPANNPLRELLKKESNMIRAIENIAEKSTGQVGKNAIGLFLQKHPTLKRLLPFIGTGIAGGGIGATLIR